MNIDYDAKKRCFLIRTDFSENELMSRMPERRYSKATRCWRAPALSRNIKFLMDNVNNESVYSPEAWKALKNGARGMRSMASKLASPAPDVVFPRHYMFKQPPMEHQRRALDKFIGRDSVALLFEQGLGKTYTSIHLSTAWWMLGDIDAVLVLCPSSIKLVWEQELQEHSPFPCETMIMQAGKHATTKKWIENHTADNTATLRWLVAGIESLSQGQGYEVVRDFVASNRTAIIVDESSKIKTPDTKRTDRCITLGTYAKKRIILSGTSVTQGVEDWYTQFRFLDPNILGFGSYYTFRDYFCRTMSMEVARNRFVTKITGYKNQEELIKLIAPHSLRVEKSQALDLPEKTYINHFVEPTPLQKRVYEEMAESMSVSLGSGYEVATVLEQLLRLQQITGGFYPYDDGTKVKPEPLKGKNPKLEHLIDIVDGLGDDKVVVWCQFRAEIELIKERLRKEGVKCVEFHGGLTDDEKRKSVHDFRTDPSVRVFLSSSAGAYGLTLVEASYAVYFSQGYSLEQYAQSQDRIHRIGQKSKCIYIHLLMQGSIDSRVMNALQRKQDVATQVYEAIKKDQ